MRQLTGLMTLTLAGCFDQYYVHRDVLERARRLPAETRVAVAAQTNDGQPVYLRREPVERAEPDEWGRVRLPAPLRTAGALTLLVGAPVLAVGIALIATSTSSLDDLARRLQGDYCAIAGAPITAAGIVMLLVSFAWYRHEVRAGRPGVVYVGGDGALHF
jgi:hypothetical protein